MTTRTGGAPIQTLATTQVADALDDLGLDRWLLPVAIRPLQPGMQLAGRARGVHVRRGPQDVLSILATAQPGDVLVVDDDGRQDGACLGDQLAAAARLRGIVGAVVWGAHRDSRPLQVMGFPVFSLGPVPYRARGPRGRPDAAVRLGSVAVADGDLVLADDDGVVLVPEQHVSDVLGRAVDLVAEEAHEDTRPQRARSSDEEQLACLDAHPRALGSATPVTDKDVS